MKGILLMLKIVVGLLSVCSSVRLSSLAQDKEPSKTSFACEDNTLTINCKDKKIFIVRANYGRQNIGICNDGGDTSGWNLQCISTRAARRVADICTNRQKCEIQATNRLFGDPCYLTPKYLEVQFKCGVSTDKPEEPPTTAHPPPPPPSSTTTSTTTSTTITPKPITTVKTTTTTTQASTTTEKPTTEKPSTKKPKPTKPTPPQMKYTTTEKMQGDQGRPKTHCDEQFVRGVHWPRQPKGSWAIMACPNNPSVRRAMWQCGRGKYVNWEGKPDLSGCESQQLHDLGMKLAMAKEDFSSEIITEVSSELQHTSARSDLIGGDLKAMSVIMDDMVKEVDKQAKNTSKPITKRFIQNVTEAVLTTSSNILADDKEDTWTDLPQATQAETATRVISAVEESAYQSAETYEEPTVVLNITLNIIMEVNVIDTRSEYVQDVMFPQATLGQKPTKADWFSSGNSIRLSGNSLKDMSADGLAKVLFLTYNNLDKWLRPQPTYQTPPVNQYNMYEELEGREAEVFDPNEIEFEPMDHEFETGPYNVGGVNQDFEREREMNRQEHVEEEVQTESRTTQRPTTTSTTFATTTTTRAPSQDAVLNDPPDKNSTKTVNSQIISASVLQKEKNAEGKEIKKKGHVPLSEPVLYTLEHKTTNNVFNPTCSFWEYSEKTYSGHWSTFGCRVKDTNVTHTTCSCNHITNFAILMDVQAQEVSAEHEFALTFITYLGCIISAICLLLCFLTFACFKNLQCDRNTIHKNLVLCLLIAEVLFLGGIMQYSKPVLCSVIAAFLHYFFLSAFLWMLLEGIQLYVMLVEVFEAEKSRVKYYYLIAYGTPALIVGISAAINHHGYGTDKHCWLAAEGGFTWAFVGPVVAIITVNIVMLSIAIYQMCKHADAAAAWKMKQKSKMENVRSWVKGASVLLVLLGLTWTFGLLYIDQHSLFMAYIFTILNSLQGLFIFIFHCVMNEKVQKEYKRCVRHATWLPETLRVKYGGAKPYSSNTPNQSSSSGNNFSRLLSGLRRKRSSVTTVRSSLSNPSRGPVYQNMKHDPTSPRESALMSDSGIGRHPDSLCNDTTEDQGGYLEPVSIRFNDHLLNEMDAGADFSTMEGSCVDTDYYGIDGYSAPLDVNKYKIKNSPRLSALSEDKGISESDYSDGELAKMAEKEQLMNEYEEILPRSRSEAELMKELDSDHYDTMLQKKLKQFAVESDENIATAARMNNLNKGDNEAFRDSVLLNEVNIKSRDDTLKRSLPSLVQDNNQYSEIGTLERLKKELASSNDALMASPKNGSNVQSQNKPKQQLLKPKSMPTSQR